MPVHPYILVNCPTYSQTNSKKSHQPNSHIIISSLVKKNLDDDSYGRKRRQVRADKATTHERIPKLKRQLNEARRSVYLDPHNKMLHGNAGQITMKGGRTDNGKKHTSIKSSNVLKEKKRYELIKVARENRELLKKLNAIEPNYDHKKFLLDWKRSQMRRLFNRSWPVHPSNLVKFPPHSFRAYQPYMQINHRLLNKHWGLDSYNIHRRKVIAAKAMVNIPRSSHVICRLKQEENKAFRSAEIDRNNKELRDRLEKIMRKGGRTDNRNMYTSKESSRAINRRLELVRVAQENQMILKRLLAVGPCYDHEGFVLDWKRKHLRRVFNRPCPVYSSNAVKFPPYSYRAYQPFQPIPHRLLDKHWGFDPYDVHRRKVNEAKAMVNNLVPKVDPHMISKARKVQNEAYRSEWQDRHNKELQDKMDKIKMKGGRTDCSNIKTNKKSLNGAKRRYELVQIAYRNQEILKKLAVLKPNYDCGKFLSDWEKHRYLVRNISRFPPPGHLY